MADYKVLITTSGIGSRLGQLTNFTNKALVTVGDKTVISHIIESYPDNTPIVITTGHFAEHVEDYLSLAYPNKNIEFVRVDNFNGPGSGLLLSMLAAKHALQCPFVFHACDTLVFKPVSPPTENWLGSCIGADSSEYRTLKIHNGIVQSICEKGEQSFDSIYIGLAGIKDWDIFWKYAELASSESQSDYIVIDKMLKNGYVFSDIPFDTWIDTGNMKSLTEARSQMTKSYNILDKEDESLSVVDGHMVKFFFKQEIAQNRASRTQYLEGLVPRVIQRGNFYKYKKVDGDVFSNVVTEKTFSRFLVWAERNLWMNPIQDSNNLKTSEVFYFDKTRQRLKELEEKLGRKEKPEFINDE